MRRTVVVIVIAAAALAAAALAYFFVVPGGSETPQAAALEHVSERGDAGSGEVLAQQDWGEGRLVLVGYERTGVARLGVAFASEQLRGWRVSSYTEETVEPDDVVLGSLLVASSEGGDGQPPWSAAVGRLTDSRVERVEVRWASGGTTVAPVVDDAYLVVERGTTQALEARFLAEDGTEIAKVPIEESRTG